MDPFTFPEDLTGLTAEELAQIEADAIAAFDALRALGDDITDEQIAEMEAITAGVLAVREAGAALGEEAAARQARVEAAAAALEPEAEVEPEPEAEATPDPEADPEPEQEPDQAVVADPEPIAASARRKAPSLVRSTPKKAVVKPQSSSVATITAAADITGIPAGSRLDDLDAVAKAFVARSKGFPSGGRGRPTSQRLQYNVATLNRGSFDGLTDENPDLSDGMALLKAAADERRLANGSLAASGGWCAPSETIYDLCDGRESLDGLLDVPEINVTRGGIRFTTGPDFSDMLGDIGQGFWQTEAQAIAGTQKPCYEITCPEFEEVRLDAVGICIKAPILTNAAYPELVRRWIEGSLVAHQHNVSATLIQRIVTALGPATLADTHGSVTTNTLTALELVVEGLRQSERMSFGDTMEVLLPSWMRVAIRADLALRTGEASTNVTNEQINAHFTGRNMRVQWLYNWQPLDVASGGLPIPAVDFPDTVQAAVYPAGTFVKGTADVISLDTVYDSTDLQSNIYTATFVEEGVLLAQTCGRGALLELPVCVNGRTGANDITDCYGVTDVTSS